MDCTIVVIFAVKVQIVNCIIFFEQYTAFALNLTLKVLQHYTYPSAESSVATKKSINNFQLYCNI